MKLDEYVSFDKDFYDLFEQFGLTKDSTEGDRNNIINELIHKGIDNNEKRLVWKILRDEYYFNLYMEEKSIQNLYNAGFFLDKYTKETEDDVAILTTPLKKVKNNLLKYQDENNLVVLLTSGGFSPVHKGHIEMMERAKKCLEKNGYKVLGGYISPSHDEYVNQKHNGKAAMNIENRVHLLELATKESNWLCVDKWEGYYREHSVNYTDVIIRLERYLNFHLKSQLNNKKIKVAFVYGSDNIEFSRVFKYKGIGVCISRGDYDKYSWDFIKNYVKGSNVFFVEGLTEVISSSVVRNGNINFLDDKVKEYYKRGKTSIEGTYEIRDDFSLSLDHLLDKFNNNKLNVLKNKLIKIIFEYIPSSLDMEILDVNSQIEKFSKEIINNKNIISLDTYAKGDFNVGVSRVFDVSDSQMKAISLLERPGSEKLINQLDKISEGDYWIVDDDTATGYTVDTIKYYLNDKVNIKGFIGLNDLIRRNNISEMYDIVDIRDFILGSIHGGLVIELPNGDISRALYALPYISVNSRASIQAGKELCFSLKIWEWNLELFKGSGIKFKNLDPNIKNWYEYVGFSKDDFVEDFILYHINYLKRFL